MPCSMVRAHSLCAVEEGKLLALGIEAYMQGSPGYKLLPILQHQADLIELEKNPPEGFVLLE